VVLELIGQLYAVEREVPALPAAAGVATADEMLALRGRLRHETCSACGRAWRRLELELPTWADSAGSRWHRVQPEPHTAQSTSRSALSSRAKIAWQEES